MIEEPNFTTTKEEAEEIFRKWLSKIATVPDDIIEIMLVGDIIPFFLPYYSISGSASATYSGKVRETERKSVWKNELNPSTGKNERKQVWENTDVYKSFTGNKSEKIKNHFVLGYADPNLKLLNNFKQFQGTGGNQLANVQKIEFGLAESEATKQIEGDIKKQLENKAKRSQMGKTVTSIRMNYNFSGILYSKTWLPVWKGSFYYNERDYAYYVNGHSGEIFGNFPISKIKVLKRIVYLIGGLSLIVLAIYLLFSRG